MKLAITGTIGSGKSTVASIFEKHGYSVIDTDQISHDLLSHPDILLLIKQKFGDAVFLNPSSIDRKKLAQIAFLSKDNLTYLENLLHPKIIQTFLNAFALHPEKNFLVQIPLLFEKKLENHFNYVISVSCNDALAFERLKKKGFSLNDIKARTQYQLPTQEKTKRAHFVIQNNSSLEALYSNTILLIQKLKSYD